MNIAVLGLWHQGIVGSACLADMGHDVLATDGDVNVIAELSECRAPIYEPGLNELIAKGVAAKRLAFTTDIVAAARAADFIFVMFDTPVNEADESELGGIFQAFEQIASALKPHAIIYVTAQVPVGTCDALMDTLRRVAPDCTATIAYSPENLRLGQAIARFMEPPLPVIGCDDPATFSRLLEVLGPLAKEWHQVGLRSAEMMKHALNSYLALTICFANEIGNICDEVGADGKRVGELLRLEPRVGSKAMLSPGLGFSGGTLARDMQTLRELGRKLKINTPLLDGAWTANTQQNRLVMRKLARVVGELSGTRIAVLGLTYKPDTSTLRRSAAIEVVSELSAAGAIVGAHDPRADRDELAAHEGFTFFDDPLSAAVGAEALILMTPWNDYRDLDFAALKEHMARPYVLDTAGLWDAGKLTSLGFDYDDIGRGRRRAS